MKYYVVYDNNNDIHFEKDPGDQICYHVIDTENSYKTIVDEFCHELHYDIIDAYKVLALNNIIPVGYVIITINERIKKLEETLDDIVKSTLEEKVPK